MAVRAPADLSPAGALGWVKALREATAAAESARAEHLEIVADHQGSRRALTGGAHELLSEEQKYQIKVLE